MPNLIRKDIQAFILSVEKEPRNLRLLKDLKGLGIPYEIITGATPEIAFQYSQLVDFKGHYRAIMSKQQMACTYGHRLMLKEALKNQAQFFLFLEDDAVLDVNNLHKLLLDVSGIPTGIVLLGACGGFAVKNRTIGDFQLLKTVGDTAAGSHAYLVHKDSVPDLFEGTSGCKFLADSFSRKNSDLFVILPYCASQLKDSFTYIPLESNKGSHSWIRNLLAPLKMDIVDLLHTGVFGGRFLRLHNVEKYAQKIFIKLPGCTSD